jgi:SAM-dependent methyltransferase
MRNLEIGPGRRKLGSDWVTMDCVMRPGVVDKVHDLREVPLPFKDGAFDLVYLSHVLEHVEWTKTHEVLLEIHRILAPGGKVEIWVPDLRKLVAAYLDNTLIKNDGWYRYNEDRDPVRWFNGRLFTYGPGEENFHRAAFDEPFLTRCLRAAGFKAIEPLNKPRGSDHGWINLGMRGTK